MWACPGGRRESPFRKRELEKETINRQNRLLNFKSSKFHWPILNTGITSISINRETDLQLKLFWNETYHPERVQLNVEILGPSAGWGNEVEVPLSQSLLSSYIIMPVARKMMDTKGKKHFKKLLSNMKLLNSPVLLHKGTNLKNWLKIGFTLL